MLTLYSYPNSRSLRVAWVLEELGVDYHCQHVALDKGEGRAEAHLARHPDGKVPVIEEGELTLFESTAICRYLAERYDNGGLLPAALADRAQVDQWLSFIVTELEQPLWQQAKHTFALPRDKRVPEVLPTAEWEFQRSLQALLRRHQEPVFLVGNTFTLADLFLTHTLSWATNLQHPMPEVLIAYCNQHKQRDALTRALAKERAALPQHNTQ